MVSGGLARGRDKARYRRRKPLAAIMIVALLGVAVVIVWTKVFAHDANVNAVVACTPGPTAPSGVPAASVATPLPYDALDKVSPEPAVDVQVRVVNASTTRGAAVQASDSLALQGFKVGTPDVDPLYPQGNMNCRGQIRFGANGESAARTLSLVLPCTQLVRDNRQDATVDVAVGKNFSGVISNSNGQQALKQLASWASTHPAPQGGQLAQNVLPQLNPTLLSAAHSNQC